jgi:hypothetical protein
MATGPMYRKSTLPGAGSLLIAAVAAVVVLVAVDWLNVPIAGDVASWILAILGGVVGAFAGIPGFLFGILGWIPGAVAGLIAGGIGLIPIVLLLVAVVVVGIVVIAIVLRGVEEVTAKVRDHRFAIILSAASLVAGFVMDLASKAAGLETPANEALGLTQTLAALAGGVFVRRARFGYVALGGVLIVLVPAFVLWRVVTMQPFDQLLDRLRAVPPGTMVGLALVVVLLGAVSWIAWREKEA